MLGSDFEGQVVETEKIISDLEDVLATLRTIESSNKAPVKAS